ncbi:MAG: SDR family oxidoreductase [Ilumatobacteraceae bacterium]
MPSARATLTAWQRRPTLIGNGVIGTAVDVEDPAAVTAWVDDSAARLGGLDVVVTTTSAKGGIPPSIEGWRRSFEVDVLGTVAVIDAALPHLRAAGAGSIVCPTTTPSTSTSIPRGASVGPTRSPAWSPSCQPDVVVGQRPEHRRRRRLHPTGRLLTTTEQYEPGRGITVAATVSV